MSEPSGCGTTRELIPEMAAGVAAGDERAHALKHLAHCSACRGELDAASTAVDELLLLAPAREPPAGLAESVLAKVAPPARPPRRRTTLLWAASVAVATLLTGGGVWWSTADDRRAADSYHDALRTGKGRSFSAAPVTERSGRQVGSVFIYRGSPSWMYAIVDSVPGDADHAVRVTTWDGRQLVVGWLRVYRDDGRGAWGRTVGVPVEQISTVEFVWLGSTTMSARFNKPG
jgi:hypothetical protein